MLARVVFGASGEMANGDHVVGAVAITVAIIAISGVASALRLVNAALGPWLVAAPFLLSGDTPEGCIAGIALGLALVALGLSRGRHSLERYASRDTLVP